MSRLPDKRAIEAALALTTRRLAAELRDPRAEPPDWTDFEWRAALAVCAMHGISVLLAERLRWRGPALWQAFLAQQQLQGRLRQQRISGLLERLDSEARRTGLAIVGLKGSALLPLKLYGAGARPMGDIDLLVREADTARAGALITGLGYRAGTVNWRHQVFNPVHEPSRVQLGEHADNPVRIELHPHVTERMAFEAVELTRRIWPPAAGPGLQPYASEAALMQHLLLHAAGNIATKSVRLLQLEDIARLSAGWTSSQWSAVLADTDDGPPWWALPPLRLAARQHSLTLPPALLQTLERACPWPLERASRQASIEAVSLSNARAVVFPGIAWSRTPARAWRLVCSRLVPNAETRQARRVGIDDHPAGRATPWAASSQMRRVVQWLSGRAMRPFTVLALQLALDYEAP